jgi:hypothetical protein
VLGALTVLFAVALEGVKPLAVASAFAAFRSLALFRGVALGLLASVAVAYSLTAELGLMAGARGDLAAGRAQAVETAQLVKDRHARAKAELATLKATRPVGELEALIAKAARRSGGCGAEQGTGRWVCPKSRAQIELEAELGRAKRRADLESVLSTAENSLSTAHAVKAADPGASALATYMAALGFTIGAGTLSEWLVLVPVLALEIGSALAVILVQSVSGGNSSRGTPSYVELSMAKPSPNTSVKRGTAPEARVKPSVRQSVRELPALNAANADRIGAFQRSPNSPYAADRGEVPRRSCRTADRGHPRARGRAAKLHAPDGRNPRHYGGYSARGFRGSSP